jgi:hypothetical protein
MTYESFVAQQHQCDWDLDFSYPIERFINNLRPSGVEALSSNAVTAVLARSARTRGVSL